MVTGESAGGGLAAALVLLARHRGECAVAFQHLVFPMLDDRTVTPNLIEAWRVQTRGPFSLRLLPGNHFFLNTARKPLLQAVCQDLRPNLA